jgi:hypothetical protein
MFQRLSRFFKGVALLEAGSAILFFGSLIHRPDLAEQGLQALRELEARGYVTPTPEDPLRVYPAETSGLFDGSHAGGWRPGVISIRENPVGSVGRRAYLRHELMHEASFRTCGGKLPIWAEEAAAMDFAGDPGDGALTAPATEAEIVHLRRRVRLGARLDAGSYRTLSAMVASYGWPREACAVSGEIAGALQTTRPSGDPHFSYVLASVLSGRVLESEGDLGTRHPPGSLLKIPYAAALRGVPGDLLGEELASSDTARLLGHRAHLDLSQFRLLLSPIPDSLLADAPPEGFGAKEEALWKRYLGERDPDGGFPLEGNLREITLVLRASLLWRPAHFSGLSRNGFMEGSTLYPEPESDKRILRRLRAISKTGTVSDARGNPLVGHLMVAWPVEAPLYLAIFRSQGMNGGANIRRASKILEKWESPYPAQAARVRVRLLSLAPRSSWEILEECPGIERDGAQGWRVQVSTCGSFRILSTARGSQSERLVSGVLHSSPDGQMVVLETDPETYADGVLFSEAQDLRGEARKALRAAIVWNATWGSRPHTDTQSLCDTTHCMVFRGSPSENARKHSDRTDSTLLRLLDRLATQGGQRWLPFSKGGVERWEREISAAELQRAANEPRVLDVRRERTGKGDVVIHLDYTENAEVVSCEIFRNRLKLPSCPEAIRPHAVGGAWVMTGTGEGHGQGFSVERARALAQSGLSAAEILTDAYGR